MGRWTILHHTMPNSDRAELCLQLHHYWPKRDLILARPYLMVESNSLWTHCHSPQATCSLPIPSTSQRSPHHFWYSIQIPDINLWFDHRLAVLFHWHNLALWIVGEWWKADTETIINQAMQSGGAPNVSDAHTINGLPGPLYNCSAKGDHCYIKIYIGY